ncbi:hypothetical protein [Kitasatospora sp. NPDC088346]|uniref:hypothetical protein n=1 Tax=Kitasatospora sp. NPDC088346 TaxID=3364073 RepID=UPI003813DD74
MTAAQPAPERPELTAAERAARTRLNRSSHAEARRAEQLARGPGGLAAAWWDTARAIAKRREAAGDPTAWARLSAYLKDYCDGYAE